MWCCSRMNGTRSFHATPEAAKAAAGDDTAVVIWFDSFDYERHNAAGALSWLRIVTDEERAVGRAFVAELLAELRARWIDPWGVEV